MYFALFAIFAFAIAGNAAGETQTYNNWNQANAMELVRRFIDDNQSLNHYQFAFHLYNALYREYGHTSERYFFVLSYDAVSGWNNHAITQCGGGTFFRVAGNRNVVVASADRTTSNFNLQRAKEQLEIVDRRTTTNNDAEVAWNEMKVWSPGNCRDVALRAAICGNCQAAHVATMKSAYRKMNQNGNNLHTYLFG